MAKKTLSVLLQKDVKSLGEAGEIKMISAGYARNYLIPQGLALLATPEIVEQKKAEIKRKKEQEAALLAAQKRASESVAGQTVTIRVKAGQKGRLFGSVTKKEIVRAINDQLGKDIKTKDIKTKSSIKTLGKHTIVIKFSPKVSAELTLQIVSAKS